MLRKRVIPNSSCPPSGNKNGDVLSNKHDFRQPPAPKRSSSSVANTCSDDSQQITGKITELMIPQNVEEFNGWCRMKIMDETRKITYVVEGMLPFIDFGFLYTLRCRDTRAKCYQNKKGVRKNTHHPTHDTILAITSFVRVDKLALTTNLLIEFLSRFCHMTETAAIRHVSSIPPEDMNVGALRNYSWFTMVSKATLFFIPDELIMVSSYFGIESMYRMMRLDQEKLEQILQMAKTEPYKLCAISLHKLGNGVGEMSLEGLKYCTDTFRLPSIQAHINAALVFYKRQLKTLLDSRGHAFLTLSELKRFPISPDARKFLRDNNLLIQENGKFYTPESAMERNKICKFFEGIISRGSSEHARFRVFRGGKVPDPERDFKELKCADGSILDPEQSLAVALSFSYPIVCIDGAPGTGKTSKVASMILNLHSREGVVAVSPTGNAAEQFSKQTGKECHTIDRLIVMIKRTLRLIRKNEMAPEGTKKKKLPNMLHKSTTLMIDEASMLTQTKLEKLLELLPLLQQFILFGDLKQGKPIGRGQPFSDLQKRYPQCTIRLERNYRIDQGSRTLLKLCESVTEKIFDFSFVKEDLFSDNPCVFMQRFSPAEGGLIKNLEKIFSHFPLEMHDDIQVITHKNSTRKKVNQWYWDKFVRDPVLHSHIPPNFSQKIFVVGQRVVITENVEAVNVYKTGARSDSIKNGEVATIVSIVDEFYEVLLSLKKKPHLSVPNTIVPESPRNDTIDGIPSSVIDDMSDDQNDSQTDDEDDDDDDDDEDDDDDGDEHNDGDDDDDDDAADNGDDHSRSGGGSSEFGEHNINVDSIMVPKKKKKGEPRIRKPQHTIEQFSTHVVPLHGYRRIINLSNGKRIDLTEVGSSRLECATCITITKSQGKEFPILVFAIEPNDSSGDVSPNFTSDWLFVGLSRARKKVIVVCDYQRTYESHILGQKGKHHMLGEFGKIMLFHPPVPINSDLHEYLMPLN